MLRVKTARDVKRLRGEVALNPKYLDYLEELFGQLQEALCSVGEDEFNLESHGYIVIIEQGDDPRTLQDVGLGRGGLLATWPEFVEVVNLRETCLYKVGVLYDNEYMMHFLSVKGQLDEEGEAWLQELAEQYEKAY